MYIHTNIHTYTYIYIHQVYRDRCGRRLAEIGAEGGEAPPVRRLPHRQCLFKAGAAPVRHMRLKRQ